MNRSGRLDRLQRLGQRAVLGLKFGECDRTVDAVAFRRVGLDDDDAVNGAGRNPDAGISASG